MEEFSKTDQIDLTKSEEVVSIPVRAGKRTYFFDLKKSNTNNHYLVITESRKKFDESNLKNYYDRQKIFIYKDDLENFSKALQGIIDYLNGKVTAQEIQVKDTYSNDSFIDFDNVPNKEL